MNTKDNKKKASSSEFDKAIDPFFWEELTPRVQKVIAKNAVPIRKLLLQKGSWGPLNCDSACALWAKAFRDVGIPVKVKSGHYISDPEVVERVLAGSSPPLLSDHVWLEVDGKLVDPTAGQFKGEIRKENYFDARRLSKHNASARLLRLAKT